MKWRVSVGRRINTLVIFQAAAMVFVIGMAMYGMRQLIMDADHMYRFQLVPVSDIATHLEKAAELQRLTHPDPNEPTLTKDEQIVLLHKQLQEFNNRYRQVWESEHEDNAENRLFIADLKNANQLQLLDKEKVAFDELEESLEELKTHFDKDQIKNKDHWESVIRVRQALGTLLALNVDFAEVSHRQIEERALKVKIFQLIIGFFSLVTTVLLGMYVHKAIAPRITRLVSKVSRFKEYGVNEKFVENGRDEITILAHAIDAGFVAIAERDKERDHFLAVAAHELKTPISSIQGFSNLLLSDRITPEARTRALDIISKQSWRLNRLVEGLFMMMRARSGNLKFNPAPVNLAALSEKIVQEVRPFMPSQEFDLKTTGNFNILGDELLLGHALWSLFTCASTFSVKGAHLEVSLKRDEFVVHLEVKVPGVSLRTEELESLFAPLHIVEFESGSAVRSATGLYLSREIVRIHNGRLYFKSSQQETFFCLELPA